MALSGKAEKEFAPAPFIVQRINNNAGVEEIGSHLPGNHFVHPSFAFLAEFLHPSNGSGLEFRMIFVLPCTRNVLQRPDLLKTPEFSFGCLREKFAAAALADQSVDFGDDGLGDDDVSSPCVHK